MTQILVVDDSPIMRQMILACLAPLCPERVVEAESGLDAMEKLALEPFDLMVLDYSMPDVTGLEVLEFVRSDEALRRLPVMLVTSRSEAEEELMAAGATAFLAKPFDPDSLEAKARELLAGATDDG